MLQRIRPLSAILVGFIVFGLVSTVGVLANPQDYPQFAQQKVDDAIPIGFASAETVKQRLDDGTRQLLVDVRTRSGYAKGHLPGAISIPLQEMPHRVAEIPRDIPVVLY